MLKIAGHRGARGLAPENTIKGLQKAIEHGVNELEVDARVSRDGVAFLCHNQFLRNPAGTWLNVRNHDFKELLQHKADLPTLEDALRSVDRKVPVQIEVKWGEDTAPIIAVLKKLLKAGWQADDFLFGSKKQQTLRELHEALPEVPVVVIEPYLSIRGRLRAKELGTKRLSMNAHGLWPFFIRSMTRDGYELWAYDTNDPSKVRRWQQHGLAGVVTDFPDRFEGR